MMTNAFRETSERWTMFLYHSLFWPVSMLNSVEDEESKLLKNESASTNSSASTFLSADGMVLLPGIRRRYVIVGMCFFAVGKKYFAISSSKLTDLTFFGFSSCIYLSCKYYYCCNSYC